MLKEEAKNDKATKLKLLLRCDTHLSFFCYLFLFRPKRLPFIQVRARSCPKLWCLCLYSFREKWCLLVVLHGLSLISSNSRATLTTRHRDDLLHCVSPPWHTYHFMLWVMGSKIYPTKINKQTGVLSFFERQSSLSYTVDGFQFTMLPLRFFCSI